MKYLRHKEKQFLIPYTTSMETPEWEVIEEQQPSSIEDPIVEAPARKKPGPKPKVHQPE